VDSANEAVIRCQETIDLSLFGAGQMQGIEGSMAKPLKIIGTLERFIGQDDPLRRQCEKFRHVGPLVTVRVIQDFRFQNFAAHPSHRSLKDKTKEFLNSLRLCKNARLIPFVEQTNQSASVKINP
jgi:hypothetical protein